MTGTAGSNTRYFVDVDGSTKGPYTVGQLRSMWAAGAVTGETLHLAEGSRAAGWAPLRLLERQLEAPHSASAIDRARTAPGTSQFAGPPKNCRHCGGRLKKGTEAKSEGSGCLVLLVGLVLTPALIGIPIALYGLSLMNKREGFWRCKSCGAKFPRAISWLTG